MNGGRSGVGTVAVILFIRQYNATSLIAQITKLKFGATFSSRTALG